MSYACSDWSIPVFGSQYPNTEISHPNCFFLNNYCGYFIKELPNGFPCLNTLIQTLGMLLDFRKAKNTRLAARVFLCFSQVSQHPACLVHVIQTWKTMFKTLFQKRLTFCLLQHFPQEIEYTTFSIGYLFGVISQQFSKDLKKDRFKRTFNRFNSRKTSRISNQVVGCPSFPFGLGECKKKQKTINISLI